MDEWFKVIVNALKTKQAHPDERRLALVRAGLIAQAYSGSNNTTLTEVFGSNTSADSLQDSANIDEVGVSAAC